MDQGYSIVITGVGSTSTTFEKASFKLTVSTEAQSGPEAKNKAQSTILAVQKAIEAHKDVVDTQRLRTTFSVSPNRVYRNNEHVLAGYKATWTCEFDASDVSKATVIHDALTSITGVSADTPVFHVKDDDEGRVALQHAMNNAQANFQIQCKMLGLDPDDYRIASWSTENERPVGKMMALECAAYSADEPEIKIVAGQATIVKTVRLVYVLK